MAGQRDDSPQQVWWQLARRWFSIDARSLALFRVCIALLLLVDLAIRVPDLTAMYTDGGILPIEEAVKYNDDGWQWSLHFVSGSAEFQAILFVVAAVFALALLIGYKTRLATVASWALLLSIHVRMPLVVNGGDILLRIFLFWSMFLPLGETWSIDACRRRGQDRGGRVLSVGTAAILLQLVVVYLFSGIFKCDEIWLSGEALSQIFSFTYYTRPFSQTMLAYPRLLSALTVGTVLLELIGPLLLFLPWKTGPIRLIVMLAFIGMHIGIELTLAIGVFSYVSLAGWLLFLPEAFWSSRLVRYFGRWARRGPAAGTASREIQASRRVPQFAKLASSALCVFFLIYVLVWNLATIPQTDYEMPSSLRPIASAVMIRQEWSMFSKPPVKDPWFVYRAKLSSGAEVDIMRGGSAVNTDFRTPERFRSHRWRKLHWRLLKEENRRHRKVVTEYLCRSWNEEHGPQEQIVLADMIQCGKDIPRLLDIGRATLGQYHHTRWQINYARVELGRPEQTSLFSRRFDELVKDEEEIEKRP